MNYQHGYSGSSTYYAWQNLKRTYGGICLSWRKFDNFLVSVGRRPSADHWLFRSRPYQRSRKGNVCWKTYKRQPQPLWDYLTSADIEGCKAHIAIICKRGGYDLDVGINELYFRDLSKFRDPVARVHSWIKRYLPKMLAGLKRKRKETTYNDEVHYA